MDCLVDPAGDGWNGCASKVGHLLKTPSKGLGPGRYFSVGNWCISFSVMNTDVVREPVATDWCTTDMSEDDILEKIRHNGSCKTNNVFFRAQSGHSTLWDEQRPGVPMTSGTISWSTKRMCPSGNKWLIEMTDISDVVVVIYNSSIYVHKRHSFYFLLVVVSSRFYWTKHWMVAGDWMLREVFQMAFLDSSTWYWFATWFFESDSAWVLSFPYVCQTCSELSYFYWSRSLWSGIWGFADTAKSPLLIQNFLQTNCR